MGELCGNSCNPRPRWRTHRKGYNQSILLNEHLFTFLHYFYIYNLQLLYFPTNWRKTIHRSPVKAMYGVCFISSWYEQISGCRMLFNIVIHVVYIESPYLSLILRVHIWVLSRMLWQGFIYLRSHYSNQWWFCSMTHNCTCWLKYRHQAITWAIADLTIGPLSTSVEDICKNYRTFLSRNYVSMCSRQNEDNFVQVWCVK